MRKERRVKRRRTNGEQVLVEIEARHMVLEDRVEEIVDPLPWRLQELPLLTLTRCRGGVRRGLGALLTKQLGKEAREASIGSPAARLGEGADIGLADLSIGRSQVTLRLIAKGNAATNLVSLNNDKMR